MKDQNKTKAQLIAELNEIRHSVAELESRESTYKRTEQEFYESEKQYRLIAQHVEDIIWTTDMELQITYASPSLERALGYSAKEIMALGPDQFLTPESLAVGLQVFREEVSTARANPDPDYARVLELEYCRKNGSTFWIEMKFSFFRDSNGQLTGILGVGRDVTTHKQIEHVLKQRVREMQSLQATVLEITSPHELSSLLYTIVERAANLLEADTGGMYLCDSEREEVRCVVSYNTPKDYTGVILKYGEGAAGFVAQSGEPLILDDYRTWSGSAKVFNEEKPFERLVSAPMLWQGQVIGVIHVLRSKNEIPFSQADLELLSYFANYAAIAVVNARQLDSLQMELVERRRVEKKLETYAHRMTLLNELTQAALRGTDLSNTLQMLADHLGSLLEAHGTYITLWDDMQQRTVPIMAYGPMREKYSAVQPESGEATLTEAVLLAGHALVIENTFDTPYLSSRLAALFPERSLLALPMLAGEQKLGAVLIAFNQLHHFTKEEITFSEQTARQIALVVSRLLNLQEAQRLAQEQSLLFKAARDFSAGLDEERILSAITIHLTTALQVDGCTISRYEPEQDRIVTLLDFDNAPTIKPEPVGTTHMLEDYPVTRLVLESCKPVIVHADDLNTDIAERAVLEKYGYTTMMMVPLTIGDRVFGLLELSRKRGDSPFTPDDKQIAQTLASTAAVALENGRLHADVQALAVTDSLTGLTNRRAFDRALESEIVRATRYGHPVALLFIDIDYFKQYNDTYGHPAGDKRLVAIAHLFQRNIRHPDLVARYGGEEFVILLPYSNKGNALILAERLRSEAEKMYDLSSNSEATVKEETRQSIHNPPIPGYTVSVGVAACPKDARTPEELLQAADAAALAAKRCGKNCVYVAPDQLMDDER